MAALRALGRLARLSVHLLRGLRRAARFDRLDAAARHAAIGDWSRGLLAVMGLEIEASGILPDPSHGAVLIVCNHVSWLDIAVLHAHCPQARFVSKADVLRWPLLGKLVRASGTLFIERAKKRDALRVVHEVAAALARGETVALFPEGTTGPGDRALPFHANLLQAALASGRDLQPVALRYTEPGRPLSPAAQYIGDTTLLGSLWRLAAAPAVSVHLHVLPPIQVPGHDRRSLALTARSMIDQVLRDQAAAASPR